MQSKRQLGCQAMVRRPPELEATAEAAPRSNAQEHVRRLVLRHKATAKTAPRNNAQEHVRRLVLWHKTQSVSR
eukprot:2022312-Rhodomonas_salina.1